MKKRTLLWYRNDLRVHDHEGLCRSAQNADTLALFCVDPALFGQTSNGFVKTGPFRTRFLLESLKALRSELRNLGGELLVKKGKPDEIIPDLVDQYSIDEVWVGAEATPEEQQSERKVRNQIGSKLHMFWGSTLYHREDLPFEAAAIPDVFTNFRKKTEKESRIRKEFKIPANIRSIEVEDPGQIPEPEKLGIEPIVPDERAVMFFKGGEKEALKRLNEYFWEKDSLKNYKETRNGLMGADYSSKFSPWLANGCISPRRIYYEVEKYEKERVSNSSTYWLIFELIWRDFFRFSALKYGSKLFSKGGIQGKDIQWNGKDEVFNKWCSGETGFPFIDANMRELNSTGFMSNRGRQVTASFLSQNLNVDWRKGAEYFESKLIDYDPASNYGNWAYNSAVGQDPRNRYFNIISQAEKYDRQGEYVRYWIPEIKQVPDELIHTPYRMNANQQSLYGVNIGVDYPKPMINLEVSYEEIKKRT